MTYYTLILYPEQTNGRCAMYIYNAVLLGTSHRQRQANPFHYIRK